MTVSDRPWSSRTPDHRNELISGARGDIDKPEAQADTGRMRTIVLFATTMVVVVAGGSSALGTAAIHAADSCRLAWRNVSGPAVDLGRLSDVAARSPGDVWAVGTIDNRRTLIEHWNGRKWRLVRSPNGKGRENKLEAVAVLGQADAWAVGTQGPRTDAVAGEKTLIEHWDGHAWKTVSSPNPKAQASELKDVTAISANDVWAVGAAEHPSEWRPLVEHWDGRHWTIVPTPSGEGELFAAGGVTSDDVWAVGSGYDSTGSVLTEHWDGKSWQIVLAPPFAGPTHKYAASLYAISADAADDVWAVGYVASESLVDRWDGHKWTSLRHQYLGDVGSGEPALSGVAALSPTDVWIAGNNGDSGLKEHWNGRTWKVQQEAGFGIQLSAVSSRNLWAVSYSGIEHYACSR
jgi:hypothetical protein